MGNPLDPNDPDYTPPNLGVTDPTVKSPSPSGSAPTIGITDPPTKSPDPGTPDPWAGTPDNYKTVRGYYQSFLGRDAENPGVVANWLNGAHGNLDQVRAGIAATDEAKAYDAARLAPGAGAATGGGPIPPASSGRPSGGNLRDSNYASQLVSYYASQPGANPSLTRDPNYWIQKITSGELGSDENYIIGKFMTAEGAPAGSGGVTGTGPAPGQGNGTDFADPAYQALNALAKARIASLQGPQSFPQLDALMQQLQTQQGVNKQRAADLASKWGSRVTELQQPLLTTPQVVQQRAMAENPLLASRDAALANAKARQSARGFAPTSGLANDEARQINENASNQQGQIDARLEQGNIGTDEARRNEATQLQGLITQALNGGDATALQEQAQTADLENQLYQTDQQRQTQQLATAQIPVDLTNTGFNNARSAVSDPTSAFSSLMPLITAALTGQKNAFDQSNSQSSGLAALIARLFGLT